MTFEYRWKSPLKSDISTADKSIVSAILDTGLRARFGISDDNLIRAIMFYSPPEPSITELVRNFTTITSIGVDTPLYNENPMDLFRPGCLDHLVDAVEDLHLILFLANRVPITVENLSTLSKIKSLRYLRLVGNNSDQNVHNLFEFENLESITISRCLDLDPELVISLVSKTHSPEICLSRHQVPPNQLDKLQTITDVRII